jgi:putative flippase GtrA
MVTVAFRKLGLAFPGNIIRSWFFQVLKFASVGIINTGVDLGIYFLLTRSVNFFGDFVFLSKAFSYSMGVITSYTLNRHWTFKSNISSSLSFLSFVAVNLFSGALNAGMLMLFIKYLSINEVVAIFFVTLISFIWNFLASKFLVFRDYASDRRFADESRSSDDVRDKKALALVPRIRP